MSREKRIDVRRSDYHVVDREFDSMRDRFEMEMKRVEEEMGRLRREFEGYTPRVSQRSEPIAQAPYQPALSGPPPMLSHGPPSAVSHGFLSEPSFAGPPVKRYDPYLESIKSPLIRDESDGKTLRLRFDVAQYRPEEVTVKTVDNRLLVHAKHEEKSPQRTVFREYNQEFMLPRGTNPEYITSTLSVDGVLTVEAPLPAIEGSPSMYRHQIGYQ